MLKLFEVRPDGPQVRFVAKGAGGEKLGLNRQILGRFIADPRGSGGRGENGETKHGGVGSGSGKLL